MSHQTEHQVRTHHGPHQLEYSTTSVEDATLRRKVRTGYLYCTVYKEVAHPKELEFGSDSAHKPQDGR